MEDNLNKIPIRDYTQKGKAPPVYRIEAFPSFSPVDINVQFLMEEGWGHADRMRFHPLSKVEFAEDHPLATILSNLDIHLFIRRYDREKGLLLTIIINREGEIEILSNHRDAANRYLEELFLECPPSFHSNDEIKINSHWVEDKQIQERFLGLLYGALGWDTSHQIPSAINISLEEAEKALSIGSYRSCVVMCRRIIEALLEFAFPRLLGKEACDKKGRTLTLNKMIREFESQKPPTIPKHLIHILDTIRLVGNIPGAHAKEIENYQFSKSDAEYVLSSAFYFVDQYFSKIDKEISQYYTLTIDLGEQS